MTEDEITRLEALIAVCTHARSPAHFSTLLDGARTLVAEVRRVHAWPEALMRFAAERAYREPWYSEPNAPLEIRASVKDFGNLVRELTGVSEEQIAEWYDAQVDRQEKARGT